MQRNMKLVDTVIELHNIARVVEEETKDSTLSYDIRCCADRLHELSLVDNKVAEIINKAKQ